MVRYVLTLPLNAIPVLGTAFFVGYNGIKAGPYVFLLFAALLPHIALTRAVVAPDLVIPTTMLCLISPQPRRPNSSSKIVAPTLRLALCLFFWE